MTLDLPSPKPETQPVSVEPGQAAGVPWYSVAQFGLSMLVILALWGLGLSTLLAVVTQRLYGVSGAADVLPVFLITGSLFFMGLLLLPSAYYSLMRTIGHPVEQAPRLSRWIRPTLLIFILPGLLAIGYWISQNSSLSWLLLPPVHVLAISLPLLWLAYLGIRDLPLGSPQRAWGVFASGVALAPPLILFAELAALAAGLILGMTALATDPGQVDFILRLVERLQSAPPSQEAVLQILQPILNNPLVIFSVIAFAAVVVPLIEEAIKPIGLWLLAGRQLDPAAGFAAGLLSGAGYAVIESLLLTSSGQEWVFLVFARIGTGAVHILTSGLVGWALVQALNQTRQQGAYIRLGAVYLFAVLVHGTWNGLTMFIAFTSLTPAHGAALDSGLAASLSQAAPFLLGAIAALSFVGLILANRLLARRVASVRATPGGAEARESVV